MSETPKWSEAENLFWKELRRNRAECDKYQKYSVIAFMISFIIIAKSPIVGGVLVAASWLCHNHFATRNQECKQNQQKLLASKGIKPDDFWIHGVE